MKEQRLKIYPLLEVASKVFPTKSQLEVVLLTWEALGIQQRATKDYLEELRQAIEILANSQDISEFLSKLK